MVLCTMGSTIARQTNLTSCFKSWNPHSPVLACQIITAQSMYARGGKHAAPQLHSILAIPFSLPTNTLGSPSIIPLTNCPVMDCEQAAQGVPAGHCRTQGLLGSVYGPP